MPEIAPYGLSHAPQPSDPVTWASGVLCQEVWSPGFIRRYVGKGTNLATFTTQDLRTIEHRINTIPRRSLDWSTAHDRYHAAGPMTG